MTVRLTILLLLLGCAAFAGAPELRSVLPPVLPPKMVTVTANYPCVIYVSADLREPFSPLTGWSTNRYVAPAVATQMFFSAIATNFPFTNVPALFKWTSVPEAASYWIYVGDGATNWNQKVQTYNKTQLTAAVWKVWPTNTVAMTAVNSNGVESAMSKIGQWSPQLRLGIRVN